MSMLRQKIRRACKAQGITQRELAARAGISEAQLSQILSPDGNPTVRTLARIGVALKGQLRIRFVPKVMHEQERMLYIAA